MIRFVVQSTIQRLLLLNIVLLGTINLVACSDEKIDALSEKISALEASSSQNQVRIKQLETIIQQRMIAPKLSFQTKSIEFEIEDKMFEPLLMGQAQLIAVADAIPEVLYVEVLIKVSAPEAGVNFQENAIHRVEKGLANIEFAHSLPKHGIKRSQLKVTVEPIGWYRGHKPFRKL